MKRIDGKASQTQGTARAKALWLARGWSVEEMKQGKYIWDKQSDKESGTGHTGSWEPHGGFSQVPSQSYNGG